MLDISDINLIKTVAELGSINKAAEVLNTSQSTLSKKLGRLEQVLNISLFFRHNVGMMPTDAALYIIAQGQQITPQLKAVQRHIELMANLEAGELNIGIGPIIEQLYFPKVLLDFTEETENIQISLKTDNPKNLITMLSSGEMDIVLGPFSTEELDEPLIASPIQSSKIITVARAGHPVLTDPAPVSTERLAEFPVITPRETKNVIKEFQNLKPPHSPLILCDNFATTKQVAMSSDYITGGPEIIFRKELEANLLVEVPTTINSLWESYSVVRPESTKVPLVNKFLEILNRYTEL